MTEPRGQMPSIEWFMSVVVVGVAVHLLVAYVKPRLDRLGSWASASWATRSESRQRARTARIALLKQSERARFEAAMRELRCRIRATHFILFGFAFAAFAGTTVVIAPTAALLPKIVVGVCAVLTLFSLLLAMEDHVEAMRVQREMKEAAGADDER